MNLKTILCMCCMSTMLCCQHFQQPHYVKGKKKIKRVSSILSRLVNNNHNIGVDEGSSLVLQYIGVVEMEQVKEMKVPKLKSEEEKKFFVKLKLGFSQPIKDVNDLDGYYITASVTENEKKKDAIQIRRAKCASESMNGKYSTLVSDKLYDKAKLVSELYDKAKLVSELCDKVKLVSELYDKAKLVSDELCDQAKLVSDELYDKAKLVSELCDKAKLVLELCDKAKLVSELCDKAKLVSELCDKAKLVSELCDQAKLVSDELCDQAKLVSDELCDQAKLISELCDRANIMLNIVGIDYKIKAPLSKKEVTLHLTIHKQNDMNIQKTTRSLDISKGISYTRF